MKTSKVLPGLYYLREAFVDFPRKVFNKSSVNDWIRQRNPSAACDEDHRESDLLESALIGWMKQNGEETSSSSPQTPVKNVSLLSTDDSLESKVSRSTVERRSKLLVASLATASTPVSQKLRLQEISKHLTKYPESNGLVTDAGAVRLLLRLRNSNDETVKGYSRQVLSLLGYSDPPKGRGVRILSIDGGGTRGLVVLEILKHIEKMTKEPIWKTFDLICGVSAGAMIGVLIGASQKSLEECELIYKRFTQEFKSDIWGGTQRLLWTHAYYDTTSWNTLLKKIFSEKTLIETSQKSDVPKLITISAVVNTPSLQPYIFRNYHPNSDHWTVTRDYEGGCEHKIWEAVRASSAAPGYFEEVVLGAYVHQDGGILMNNPTAVAIHEAQVLWPNEPIQCCISIGTGKYSPLTPSEKSKNAVATSLRTKLVRLIDSATDTEGIHRLLQDLMEPGVYFRFNPPLSNYWYLDENRPEKLEQMRTDAEMYVRKNEYKLKEAVKALTQRRGHMKSMRDWLQVQYSQQF